MVFSEIILYIAKLAITIISTLGYFGIFFLMLLESMIFPIPSELVMPFAGFLISQGKFTFLYVLIFSSLGSLAGSLISYYIGKYGGNKLVVRFGKYLLLDTSDLKKTEGWFKKRGKKTIFIGRFIPVVRHLISIPAGMAKMNIKKFCLFTLLGATIWNMFLAYLGYLLGENWDKIKNYTEPLSIIISIILIIIIIYFIYHHIKKKKSSKKEQVKQASREDEYY